MVRWTAKLIGQRCASYLTLLRLSHESAAIVPRSLTTIIQCLQCGFLLVHAGNRNAPSNIATCFSCCSNYNSSSNRYCHWTVRGLLTIGLNLNSIYTTTSASICRDRKKCNGMWYVCCNFHRRKDCNIFVKVWCVLWCSAGLGSFARSLAG